MLKCSVCQLSSEKSTAIDAALRDGAPVFMWSRIYVGASRHRPGLSPKPQKPGSPGAPTGVSERRQSRTAEASLARFRLFHDLEIQRGDAIEHLALTTRL